MKHESGDLPKFPKVLFLRGMRNKAGEYIFDMGYFAFFALFSMEKRAFFMLIEGG